MKLSATLITPLCPEALETWPVFMFEKFLPRHLEIIYQINHFFLQKVTGMYPGDMGKLSRLSLISEEGGKRVRMAPLAILGSHSVNGVVRTSFETNKGKTCT